MKKIFLCLVVLTIAACSSQLKKLDSSEHADSELANLTRIEADARSHKIKDIAYTLNLRLNETENYSADQTIKFTLSDDSEKIRLDFFKGNIKSLILNGKETPIERTSTYLWIPASGLKVGSNELQISFDNVMQTNGTGLHRFVDPEDKSVFLYTQFEAFSANKFMPCFDQPDLKATLKLQVLAPKAWTVVSTTRESSTEEVDANSRRWIFPQTAPISTYLFSLIAGPYKIWQDQFQGMPLRLLARPSMAKYVHPKWWFGITKQGLGFYNRYFAYPYPFHKYDQLLVPEFNAGAMENVGAVTFSEAFLNRGHITRENELNTADVILHEMAHMWFGDLVTMKWWNDLWLNESFATYMSALALTKATKYKEGWQGFYAGMKAWAYYQDQLSTTHPIETNAKDTLEAFSNFDGITYGKGASVLKQMNRWLTPKAFQLGVQYYIKNNAYKNAELKDFIASLQKFSQKDFIAWSKAWLQQSGVDTVESNFTCDADQLKSISLEVSSTSSNFRPQSVELSLYKKQGQGLALLKTVAVEITEKKQNIQINASCPDLIYPNANDHGFLKVKLDKKSLASLKSHLSAVKDPLMRMMLWSNLWEMVFFDQSMSITEYAEIATQQIAAESNIRILQNITDKISYVLYYWPLELPALKEKRELFLQKMEQIYFTKLAKAVPGSDEQTLWWNAYSSTGQSKNALDYFVDILNGKQALPKAFQLDQDKRWNLVNRSCRYGAKDCLSLIESEKKKDKSDRGERAALGSEAIRPDFSVKENFLSKILSKQEMSLQTKAAIAFDLFPYEQSAFAQRLEEKYFGYLVANKKESNLEFLSLAANALSPLNCSAQQHKKIIQFLDEQKDLPLPVSRTLTEQLDNDTRCQKIRALL